MFRLGLGIIFCIASCQVALCAQAIETAPPDAKKQYTVEAIYAPSAAGSHPPAAMQWSPDGSKLSYILYGADDEQGSLYYFDPASGKSAQLIAADKLAALAPSDSKLKDERQRENRARFGVADYQWAPDSKAILFDAQGQLWIFNLAASKGRRVDRCQRAVERSQVFARWQIPQLRAGSQPLPPPHRRRPGDRPHQGP